MHSHKVCACLGSSMRHWIPCSPKRASSEFKETSYTANAKGKKLLEPPKSRNCNGWCSLISKTAAPRRNLSPCPLENSAHADASNLDQRCAHHVYIALKPDASIKLAQLVTRDKNTPLGSGYRCLGGVRHSPNASFFNPGMGSFCSRGYPRERPPKRWLICSSLPLYEYHQMIYYGCLLCHPFSFFCVYSPADVEKK